jgi:hypothetical protein
VRAQARRLLGAAADSAVARRFLREYLDYDRTLEIFKDPKKLPFHKPERLVADTDAFVREVLVQGRDFVGTLLTAPWGFARASTAPSYNLMVAPRSDTTPERVMFPAGQRAGLLTQPSFLSSWSSADENDPVRRGKWILESLLCGAVPPLTLPNVPPLPDLGANATMRERLRAHAANPTCAACHRLMDPLGLGLQAFDHAGRFRESEGGRPVDASGVIPLPVEVPFVNAGDLASKLAGLPEVNACVARHAFRFFVGREDVAGDACAVDAARAALRGQGDLGEAILALVTSDSFLLRGPAAP